MDYKNLIADCIIIEGIDNSDIKASIGEPNDTCKGDYSMPCFKFSKVLRKSPVVIAQELASSIILPEGLSEVQAINGYLNFFIDKTAFLLNTIDKVIAECENFGSSKLGEGKTICIDYSSINIAKPFHIGHLSTTVIGSSLYRIYLKLGYQVIGINHLGDWGTQFGKLIVAFKKWGDRRDVEKNGIRSLLKLYVKFHKLAEEDESLNEEGRAWFKKIEDGDAYALELFELFKKVTLTEVSKVYDRLGVKFDSYAGESFYNDKMQPILDMLEEKKLIVTSEGAKIVELENMPPCLLVKADGATLYATRDLAAAFYRKTEYDFYKCLYVVAYQQNLHFNQFFEVVRLMGCPWYKDLEHVAFGMVSLVDGTLSTRKGKILFLEEVLDKAVEKAYNIIEEKNPDLEDKAKVAEQIGVGAVIFTSLYNSRIKDITFSYDKVLSFEGETAPYIQYTYARCSSVLEKVEASKDFNIEGINNQESHEIARLIAKFPEIIESAAERNEPSYIARFAVNLAKLYNKFYFEHRVSDSDSGIRGARLKITLAVRTTLKNALDLLGISAPEKM